MSVGGTAGSREPTGGASVAQAERESTCTPMSSPQAWAALITWSAACQRKTPGRGSTAFQGTATQVKRALYPAISSHFWGNSRVTTYEPISRSAPVASTLPPAGSAADETVSLIASPAGSAPAASSAEAAGVPPGSLAST